MPSSQKLAYDLWQLEIFRTVVVTGSLTKTAQRLGMTQSAVSQVVATLEKALGAPLLDRDRRPIQPTTTGRLLAEGADDLLERARELEASIRSSSHQAIPILRISMIASLTATVGPELVHELGKTVKRCALFANLRAVSEQQFHNREIDILIGVDLLKEAQGTVSIPLLVEPYVLALPAVWDIDIKTLADLKGRNFIRHTHRTSAGRQIEHALRQLRLEFPRHFESDAADTIATMVAGGLGWSITTPLMVLQTHSEMRHVKLMPIPKIRVRRRIDLHARKLELGQLPQDVANKLCALLRKKITPMVRTLSPWMAAEFQIYDQPTEV